MANPHKFYLKHMHTKTGYRATWDPGKKLKIGQIIKLDNKGVPSVYSSLQDEGIPMVVDTDVTAGEMDYTSSDNVTITAKLSGQLPAAGSFLTQADAGVDIAFNSSKSIVCKLAGQKTHHITNLAAIQQQILQRYEQGNWDKDCMVITELVEASAATIIISNSSSGRLSVKATANVGTPVVSLTDLSLGLTLANEHGSTLKYLCQEGLTPLYRAQGVRHPLFGHPTFGHLIAPSALTMSLNIQDFKSEELDTEVPVAAQQ